MNEILVIGLDIAAWFKDKVIFTRVKHTFVHKLFVQHLSKTIETGKYKQVIICLFNTSSLRVSSWTLAKLPREVQAYLQRTHPQVEILFDPFMTSDFYKQEDVIIKNMRPPGASYWSIFQGFNVRLQEVADSSKILLSYALIHRAMVLNPGKTLTVYLYNDDLPVAQGVHQFFEANLDLMPNDLILGVLHYEKGMSSMKQLQLLLGTGEIDARYPWSVRFLAARRDSVFEIKTARDLMMWEEDTISPRTWKADYRDWTTEEINVFRNFRRTESPHLPEDKAIWSTFTYYTAVGQFVTDLPRPGHRIS